MAMRLEGRRHNQWRDRGDDPMMRGGGVDVIVDGDDDGEDNVVVSC